MGFGVFALKIKKEKTRKIQVFVSIVLFLSKCYINLHCPFSPEHTQSIPELHNGTNRSTDPACSL